ncbi:hypothetical protein F5Y16DRAFT_400107 [Xylariaceae sp. FL0255]|nr:hypothetical protein F5Y16DRAFT_400107 [Xylariaceae sp. FL0255]
MSNKQSQDIISILQWWIRTYGQGHDGQGIPLARRELPELIQNNSLAVREPQHKSVVFLKDYIARLSQKLMTYDEINERFKRDHIASYIDQVFFFGLLTHPATKEDRAPIDVVVIKTQQGDTWQENLLGFFSPQRRMAYVIVRWNPLTPDESTMGRCIFTLAHELSHAFVDIFCPEYSDPLIEQLGGHDRPWWEICVFVHRTLSSWSTTGDSQIKSQLDYTETWFLEQLERAERKLRDKKPPEEDYYPGYLGRKGEDAILAWIDDTERENKKATKDEKDGKDKARRDDNKRRDDTKSKPEGKAREDKKKPERKKHRDDKRRDDTKPRSDKKPPENTKKPEHETNEDKIHPRGYLRGGDDAIKRWLDKV